MQHLNIIQGKQTEISLQERIYNQISHLNNNNKKYCLELIMSLEAENRLIFLNAFVLAIDAMPDKTIAAA